MSPATIDGNRSTRRARLFALCAALAACGDGPAREAGNAHADASHDHDDATGEDEAEFEGCPASVPAFALGMEAEGMLGHVTGRLIAASNDPPLRYLNDWTVAFVDGAGEPLEDVTIRSARPFMPVHGHDGNLKPSVRATGEAGAFDVTGLNLNMRGPWEIQLQLRSPSAGDDYVVFHICVEE